VVGWSNALDSLDYTSNDAFGLTDFMARQNSVTIFPITGACWLFGPGLLSLLELREKSRV